jgi:hypothetical protein
MRAFEHLDLLEQALIETAKELKEIKSQRLQYAPECLPETIFPSECLLRWDVTLYFFMASLLFLFLLLI